MSWKRTVGLIAILFLSAGFYYVKVEGFHLPKNASFFSMPQAASSPLIRLREEEQIDRMVISLAPGQMPFSDMPAEERERRFVLERKGDDSWWLVEPVQYPADSMVVNGLVTLMKMTGRVRDLDTKGVKKQELGFDRLAGTVCVRTNRLRVDRCLELGREAAIARGAYAKWKDEQNYFIISPDFLRSFDRSLYSLRNKRIFSFSGDELKSIQFLVSGDRLELIREGTHWLVKKPVESMVGPLALEKIMTELREIYVKDFMDDAHWRDPNLGFGATGAAVRLIFMDGTQKTLVLGAEALGRDAYYARIGEAKGVLLIAKQKRETLENAFRMLSLR